MAQSCISESFKVDPHDKAAMADAVGTQNLLSIYGVYEKLKGKSGTNTSTTGSHSSGPSESKTPAPKDAPKAQSASSPGSTAEAEAFKGQGNAAMARKDYTAAIDLYSKALDITPLNPIYLSNRAAAYSASQRHTEASADAEMAVAADPKYTKAWSRLGLARFALGDAKGSMEAYQKGIEYEGNGGSEAMKKGFETAKKKVEDEGRMADDDDDDIGAPNARSGPGAGGMPDLSALAGMFGGGAGGGGGGGGPDLSQIMNNPMFASMAQKVMSNPDMLNNLMSNPRLRGMMDSMGGGGGGEGRGGGGMPDLASLMQDPTIADL